MTTSGKILFLQHNANKNGHNMHTCLEYEIELELDFILFQEPYVARDNKTTIAHSAYYCIVPEFQEIRPRVMIFARKQSRFDFCMRSDICTDSDILILDITDRTRSFSETIQLINIYNEKSLKEDCNEYTVQRNLHQIVPYKNTIICGDLNAHHSWWNSAVTNSKNADQLVNWLEKYEFELINEPDIQTCTRSDTSIIDLTFATRNLNNSLKISWEIDKQKVSGSDHEIILFSVNIDNGNLVENPLYSNQFNLEKADWKNFEKDLINLANKDEFQSQLDNSEISHLVLKQEAEKLRDIILKAAEKNIPKKRITEKSKCWWNSELKTLRKDLSTARRNWKRKQINQTQYITIRNSFFQAIKIEKARYWNNFLENAVGKDIFKAFNYTKFNRVEKLPIIQYQHEEEEITAVTFEQKCEAFMRVLFKKPPQSEAVQWDNYIEKDWEWPEAKRDEIRQAIFSSSIRKAPGPDKISFLILQKAFDTIENRFVKLYSNLISYGYHPVCWREAIGVILKKPNRNASLPKSYRVILLLNCLGKTAEKIIVTRLAYLAEITNIVNFD